MDRRSFLQVSLLVSGVALASCGGQAPTDAAHAEAGSGVSLARPVISDVSAEVPPPAFPARIACAGDSITWGFGVESTRDTDSYPAQLQALLAEAGAPTQVENFGLCGACALSSGKNPYTDFAEYWDSLDAGADLVILMLGTNDAASIYWDQATYEAELAERVQAYRTTTNTTGNAAQIILMVPPDILSTEWAGGVAEDKVDEMQQGARNVADALGLVCVDLEPIFGARPELFADGVHPNAEGNALIAHAIFDALCGETGE